MCVPLAPVADDGDATASETLEVGVGIVIQCGHRTSSWALDEVGSAGKSNWRIASANWSSNAFSCGSSATERTSINRVSCWTIWCTFAASTTSTMQLVPELSVGPTTRLETL